VANVTACWAGAPATQSKDTAIAARMDLLLIS
jgi:hypothetical protein